MRTSDEKTASNENGVKRPMSCDWHASILALREERLMRLTIAVAVPSDAGRTSSLFDEAVRKADHRSGNAPGLNYCQQEIFRDRPSGK